MTSPAKTSPPTKGLGAPRSPNPPVRLALPILVCVLAVAGGVLVWYATSWGPWAFSDSVSYVEAARNLAAGHGLVEITASGKSMPFIKQPPLYPFLLALGASMGVDVVDAARWLDVGLFAALVLFLGLAASMYSRRPWIHMALPLIALSSPVLLENYSGIMTEPVFLTLGFLGLMLLVAYLQRPSRTLLVLSAATVGLAAMTRYAGAAVIATALLALWLFEKASAKGRLLSMVSFCVLSATPLLLWTFAQFLHTGLQAGSHLPAGNLWTALRPVREGLYHTVWSWLPFSEYLPIHRFPIPPWRVQLLGLVFVALVPILLLAIAFRRRRYHQSSSTPYAPDLQVAAIFILASVVHVGFMVLVSLFGPWEVRIDARQLSPIFLYGCAGTFLAIGLVSDRPAAMNIAGAVQLLVAAAIVSSALPEAYILIEDLHDNGRGYTGRGWHDSALVQAVRQLPSDVVIISNDIEAIMFHTGRRAFRLPEIQTGVPSPITEQFGSRPSDATHRLFSEEGAALVMFDAANWRFAEIYGEDAATRLQSLVRGLHRAAAFPDGAIYYYRPPPP